MKPSYFFIKIPTQCIGLAKDLQINYVTYILKISYKHLGLIPEVEALHLHQNLLLYRRKVVRSHHEAFGMVLYCSPIVGIALKIRVTMGGGDKEIPRTAETIQKDVEKPALPQVKNPYSTLYTIFAFA